MSRSNEARMRFGCDAFQQCSGEPRFPDTGLAGEQHHLSFPVFAFDHRLSSSSSSSSRPTSPVSPVACSASKRLSTEAARSAAQARTGPAMPLRSLRSRSLKLEKIAHELSGAFGDDERCSAPRRPANVPQGSASRRRCRAPAPRPIRSGRRRPPALSRCRHASGEARGSSEHPRRH